MTAYGEGYEMLAAEELIESPQAVYQAWSNGTVVRSWLQQLLAKALKEDPQLAEISGYTEDSGEGRWTVEEAIRLSSGAEHRGGAVRAVPLPAGRLADDEGGIRVAQSVRWPRREKDQRVRIGCAEGGHGRRTGESRRLYVRRLGLRDFRSWAQVDIDLEPGRTVFVGPNGFGKTNLVEALWYSSTLGSHRVATDAPLVRAGADRAIVSTIVVSDGRELAVDLEINCGPRQQGAVEPVSSARSPGDPGCPARGVVRPGGSCAGTR